MSDQRSAAMDKDRAAEAKPPEREKDAKGDRKSPKKRRKVNHGTRTYLSFPRP
jgi:hypothetical protein